MKNKLLSKMTGMLALLFALFLLPSALNAQSTCGSKVINNQTSCNIKISYVFTCVSTSNVCGSSVPVTIAPNSNLVVPACTGCPGGACNLSVTLYDVFTTSLTTPVTVDMFNPNGTFPNSACPNSPTPAGTITWSGSGVVYQ